MPARLKKILDAVTSRMFVKTAFLVFFLWAVSQLIMFVRWAQGSGPFVRRPEAVAGLLPVGHYTSFFAWVRGGGWDALLPAGLVIIIGAIAVSLLFKRGFCGWICPLGTVWEWAALLGRKLLGDRNVQFPRWFDIAGRTLRYIISTLFLFALMSVSLEEAVGFRELPYMWTADIKILNGFTNPIFALVFLLAFVMSITFGPVWCRYLCPLGGWYSVLGIASPCLVQRDAEPCIDCGKCSRVCHAFIDVDDTVKPIRHTECDGCMDCVRVCPAPGALEARVLGRWRITPAVWALLVVGTWLAIYAIAKLTNNWDTSIPIETFRQIIQSGMLEQVTPGGF